MVLIAVLAAACSGSDSQSPADNAHEGDSVPAEDAGGAGGPAAEGSHPDSAGLDGVAADSEEPDWFTPYEERVYPLEAFIRDVTAEAFPEQHEFRSEPMAAIEDLTQDCMTAEGFRYVAVDWAALDAQIDASTPSLAEEDFLPLWGYGLSYSLGKRQEIEPGYVDPNEAIRAGLSPNELEAWEEQWGECFDSASAWFDQAEVMHWALQDEIEALNERISTDPRIAEATAGWSACMAQRGHGYANHDEIFGYLGSLADPLRDRLRTLGGTDQIDAALQADLDALLAIEVEIAVADLACKKRLDQALYEVTVEYQQRFLNDNEDRLALLREDLPTMTVPDTIWWR